MNASRRFMLLSFIFMLGVAAAPIRLAAAETASSPIYRDGWIDLNKNGQMDPYENPKLDIEQRIDDLLSRMNLEEKTCQMATLYGYGAVLKDDLPTSGWLKEVWKDGLANIDEHINGTKRKVRLSEYTWPPSKHAKALNDVQRFFVERTRLGIPVDFTDEGIRGLCYQNATCFPSQLGVAGAWDVDLVSAIGRITAREARAVGYTNIYSPILDLPRDPRWGRTVECYSEDPYLTSRLGVAQVRALQANGVVSTPKHFAVYSIPKGGRDGKARTDPEATWHTIQMINLAPFRAAFTEGGALGTMSSYNDYDGVPITGSHKFLTEILRQEWGFRGYVVSDSDAVKYLWNKHHVAVDYKDAVRQSVEAGLNVRTEFNPPENYTTPLRELVREGKLSPATIDSRVRDVLRVKYILGLFDRPYVEKPEAADKIVHCPEHVEVATRAARESIVLLKNEGNLLPLKKTVKSILVAGPNADESAAFQSRYGPQQLELQTVLQALKTKLDPSCEIKYAKGCDVIDMNFPESDILHEPPAGEDKTKIDAAAALAKGVDAAIVVVGEIDAISKESGSRVNLDLPGYQRELIQAIQASGAPTIVVLMNGRPLTINWEVKHVPAIVEAWFPGEKTAEAVADVLFGDVNPSGKLPITFPKFVGQIPMNFPAKMASQAGGNASVEGVLFPFGFGLSYTTFEYSNLKVDPAKQGPRGQITVTCDVKNTGARAGDEIVQLYIHDVLSSIVPYEKLLRGFQRVSLEPGQTKTVRFTLGPKDLQFLDRNLEWIVEPGAFEVMIGASSEDIRLKGGFDIAGGQ